MRNINKRQESDLAPKVSRSQLNISAVSLILATSLAVLFSLTGTEAVLSDKSTVSTTSRADTLLPPTALKITTVNVNQTNLNWTASASTYATGYKIYRSTAAYGPWSLLSSVSGRTNVSYIDTSSGSSSYFYRVEASFANWISEGPSAQAPPAVGLSFFDSFEGASSPLEGRATEDGKSTWQVWSGVVRTSGPVGTKAAYGETANVTSPGLGDVAVVRTPVHDGWVFAADFDGYERVILRGKDPKNFIYVGGTDTFGSFEIVEVKNGVPTTRFSQNMGTNVNIRVQAQGSTISVYTGATKGSSTDGVKLTSITSTFLQTDSAATYFGIGFSRGGFGIDDFTFEAY